MKTSAYPVATVEAGADREPERRDAYVRGHPRGTPFHLFAWSRAVRRAFGHEILDLVARQGDEVVGVLPLGAVRSRFFGRRLISIPFAVYGGPLANSPEIEAQLLERASTLAEERRAGYLELRCREQGPTDWPGKDLYVTFRGPIAESDDAILAAIPRKTRRMVRVGLGEGFVPDTDPALFGEFYRLFSESYRDHGTPVFGRRWLRALLDEFGDDAVLFSIRDGEGGPVAASVLTFVHGNEVAPYYSGARKVDFRRNVNNVLYFELMRWARDRGLGIFDFGRSKRGTGSYDFKKRWGLDEIPLDYRCHLVRDEELPDLNPLNPKYARRIALWRKLPLWLANQLGPWISKGLP